MKPKKSLDYGSRVARLELDVAYSLWEGLDTPVSLSCWIIAKSGDFDQLVDKRIKPCDYNDHIAFALDYQAVSLLAKSSTVKTSFNREENARKKYMQSEALCAETNSRILAFERGEVSPLSEEARRVVRAIPNTVSQILGDLSGPVLDEVERSMGFGPGSTVSIKRVVTTGRKYDNAIIDTTPNLLSYGLFCLPPMWRQRVTGFELVTESSLTFVPKNAKTFRAIEIQTSMNIYVQKGIAAPVRRRLRKFGVDLDDQSWNRTLACTASQLGTHWTIDLESASDTIAHLVVRYFLKTSQPWLALFEWARMDRVKGKDGTFSLEKFSAMGNGYTFELESLIFLAVVLACRKVRNDLSDYAVYGDDIIVSNSSADLVVSVLKFFGFNMNALKTYGNTYFRESCGADYFYGHAVEPIRFTHEGKNRDDFHEICYNYGNSIILAASRLTGGKQRCNRFYRAWFTCLQAVPKRLRFRVSTDFASGGFIGSFDECVPALRRATNGWQGYSFKYSFRPQAVTHRYALGALMGALNNQGGNFSYGEESLRGDANRLPAVTKTGYALAWPEFGPWV